MQSVEKNGKEQQRKEIYNKFVDYKYEIEQTFIMTKTMNKMMAFFMKNNIKPMSRRLCILVSIFKTFCEEEMSWKNEPKEYMLIRLLKLDGVNLYYQILAEDIITNTIDEFARIYIKKPACEDMYKSMQNLCSILDDEMHLAL